MITITVLIIPLIIILILIIGFVQKIDCFSSFKKGAEEGLYTIAKLVPTYIGLFVAVEVFKYSGIINDVIDLISPLIHIPEIIKNNMPLILLRPVSGSASLAVLENIIKDCGVSSKDAFAACVMMGSTETIFYTMSVYTNDTKIKKMPGVLPAAFFSNIISCIFAILWAVMF